MAGFGWRTDEILAHLDATPDSYLDQCAQVELERWSNGRVALLGDAACCASPMSGGGTGMALIGAYLLAGELGERRLGSGRGHRRLPTADAGLRRRPACPT